MEKGRTDLLQEGVEERSCGMKRLGITGHVFVQATSWWEICDERECGS
jgi:hypothetical protein